MKDKKEHILIGICIIIITIIICCSSFLKLIKLKIILNELDGKTSSAQNNNYNNEYIIYSKDNNKKIQINLSNKFKKMSNFDYSDKFFKYNVSLSLDEQTTIGAISIGKGSEIVSEFENTDNNKITYNNQEYMISSLTIIESLFSGDFPFAIVTPIDSEYYYTVMFTSDNSFKDIEKDDLESLLNFKVVK